MQFLAKISSGKKERKKEISGDCGFKNVDYSKIKDWAFQLISLRIELVNKRYFVITFDRKYTSSHNKTQATMG